MKNDATVHSIQIRVAPPDLCYACDIKFIIQLCNMHLRAPDMHRMITKGKQNIENHQCVYACYSFVLCFFSVFTLVVCVCFGLLAFIWLQHVLLKKRVAAGHFCCCHHHSPCVSCYYCCCFSFCCCFIF